MTPSRRAARVLLYAGTVVAVLGLGKIHAARHHYDFTGSFRFAWSFAYIALLGLAAYGIGLPDLYRGRRSALAASIGATGAAAVGISVVQLLAGSALLPRFVVFGGALLLVPWYELCTAVAASGRTREEERDRVAVVADQAEVAALAEELERTPERHAVLAAVLSAEQAQSSDPRVKPLVERLIAE